MEGLGKAMEADDNSDVVKVEFSLPDDVFNIIEKRIIGDTRYIHKVLQMSVNAVTCRRPNMVIVELYRERAAYY